MHVPGQHAGPDAATPADGPERSADVGRSGQAGSRPGSAAQVGGCFGGRLGSGLKEAGDGFPVGGRNAGRDCLDPGVVSSQAGRGSLGGLRAEFDQDGPAVAGMRATADPPGSFKPVDQHGDRPGGQGEPGAEFALRQRSRGFKVLERV